ncbi:MAG: LLM class F420-dependent oxidoreductase [Ktedonobacterales bacterium]
MRLGLQVPNFTFPDSAAQLGETLGGIAEHADQVGLYSFWVMDHFFQIGHVGPAENDMLEGWTTLGYVAGRTKHIHLGTMVTGVTYRYPGVLVKTATTLDVLSGGRIYFGVGAAWNEQEHQGLGVPFPPLAERFERLEETLQIAQQMWQSDDSAFNGKHYQLARPLNSPQAIQRPHPPILIGGGGERKTLWLVAQYGDACNLFARIGDDALQHKLDVLREHCDALGRPYSDIEKTTLSTISLSREGREGTMTPDAAVEMFGKLAAMGIDQAIFNSPDVHKPEFFELLAEVVPQADKIAVAGR